MLPATEAIRALEARKTGPTLALQNLSELAETAGLLALFKRYFPREIKKHRGARVLTDEGRKPVMREFLELVDARLFPLSLDYLIDGLEMDGVLPSSIPVMLLNVEWWEYGRSDLPPLHRAVLDGVGAFTEDGDCILDSLHQAVSREVLVKRSRHLRAPLRWIPNAVDVVGFDTGTPWLDFTEEMLGYSYDPWDAETIDALARSFRQAKGLIGKFKALEREVDESRDSYDLVVRVVREAAGGGARRESEASDV